MTRAPHPSLRRLFAAGRAPGRAMARLRSAEGRFMALARALPSPDEASRGLIERLAAGVDLGALSARVGGTLVVEPLEPSEGRRRERWGVRRIVETGTPGGAASTGTESASRSGGDTPSIAPFPESAGSPRRSRAADREAPRVDPAPPSTFAGEAHGPAPVEHRAPAHGQVGPGASAGRHPVRPPEPVEGRRGARAALHRRAQRAGAVGALHRPVSATDAPSGGLSAEPAAPTNRPSWLVGHEGAPSAHDASPSARGVARLESLVRRLEGRDRRGPQGPGGVDAAGPQASPPPERGVTGRGRMGAIGAAAGPESGGYAPGRFATGPSRTDPASARPTRGLRGLAERVGIEPLTDPTRSTRSVDAAAAAEDLEERLGRILAREARRQGIDVEGVGS